MVYSVVPSTNVTVGLTSSSSGCSSAGEQAARALASPVPSIQILSKRESKRSFFVFFIDVFFSDVCPKAKHELLILYRIIIEIARAFADKARFFSRNFSDAYLFMVRSKFFENK